ncbi:MAG: septum formation initiator family protein [Dehalococcoidia bacterium]|nr:septum formation initiator family protein [Dehalococcoidia bacterium]
MRSFARSRARLFFLACLLLAGYFTYTAASAALRNHQLDDERRDAQRELSALEVKKAYLKAVLNYASSDAYVEQEARRQLGWVREGEVPFVVVSPPPRDNNVPAGDWWQRLFPR